eukprot:TRINITY_DN6308_c0_g1_i2.p1 TRINITY_DN6308_c0_g1~~TRINITY_DN6308_c0_g1_i2.p1  ORF type:complete len:344 (-),score=50.35 TRINITY_DN6308_c0_g1_i2:236-1267(-)
MIKTLVVLTFCVISYGIQEFTVTQSDNEFIVNGIKDPVITLTRGKTYKFNIDSLGFPFSVTYPTSQLNLYEDGLSDNDIEEGVIEWKVSQKTPNLLKYLCTYVSHMGSTINVRDSSPDMNVEVDGFKLKPSEKITFEVSDSTEYRTLVLNISNAGDDRLELELPTVQIMEGTPVFTLTKPSTIINPQGNSTTKLTFRGFFLGYIEIKSNDAIDSFRLYIEMKCIGDECPIPEPINFGADDLPKESHESTDSPDDTEVLDDESAHALLNLYIAVPAGAGAIFILSILITVLYFKLKKSNEDYTVADGETTQPQSYNGQSSDTQTVILRQKSNGNILIIVITNYI